MDGSFGLHGSLETALDVDRLNARLEEASAYLGGPALRARLDVAAERASAELPGALPSDGEEAPERIVAPDRAAA